MILLRCSFFAFHAWLSVCELEWKCVEGKATTWWWKLPQIASLSASLLGPASRLRKTQQVAHIPPHNLHGSRARSTHFISMKLFQLNKNRARKISENLNYSYATIEFGQWVELCTDVNCINFWNVEQFSMNMNIGRDTLDICQTIYWTRNELNLSHHQH